MAAASRRTNQRITLLMLVLASITILTLDYRGEVAHGINHIRNGVRDALSPMQRGIAAVLHPFGDVFAGAFHYGQLETENQQLRAENGRLRLQLAANGYTASQAASVLALDRLPYIAGIPIVTSEVIGNSTSNFQDTIEINKGTASGVGTGMPVVSIGGLVGTVASASSQTATVVFDIDAGTSTPVRVGQSGLYRAAGEGRSRPLSLSYVGGSSAIRAGETVYTSGLGGAAIPAGIPVGTVHSVRVSPSGLSRTIEVTPVVNFEELQYVDVLQWLAPA